jgi:hypothetical protein
MTITAGFHFADGLLICADTQASSSVKTNTDKLRHYSVIERDVEIRMVTAISGDIILAKMAADKCEIAVGGLKKNARHINEIKAVLERTLLEVHEKHIFPHPNYGKDEGPGIQLMFGIWTRQFPYLTLLSSEETAIAESVDCVCLGSGGYIGDYLTARLYRETTYSLEHIILIATHILQQAKSYDLYCGFNSSFGAIGKDGNWSPTGYFDISSSEPYSKTWDDVMRNLFVASADLNMEDESVLGMLDFSKTLIKEVRREQRAEKQRRDDLMTILGGLRPNET